MGITRFGIKWRQVIHKPLLSIFSLTLKHRIKLLRNDYIPNGRPTIFAMTHAFKDDAICVPYCLPRSTYIVAGNQEGISKTYMVAGLFLTGVIWVNRNDRKSRSTALEQMKDVCNKGGDVLITPEGTWNFSPNLPMLKLSWGLLDVAASTGANIVPAASHLVNGEYCVIIGDYFEYEKYPSKEEAIAALRDEMATMMWEMFTMNPIVMRKEVTDELWLRFIRGELKNAPFMDYENEEKGVYRPKGEINLGELLAEMHGIDHKSMAVDYKAYRRVEQLIDNWTKPIKFYGD